MTLLFRITLIVCALLVFIYVLRKIRHSEVKIADSTILRTETAGVVAPALTLYELGKLGGTR